MRTFKFWKGRVPTNILVGVLNRCSGSAVSHLPLEKEERPPQPKPWGGGGAGRGFGWYLGWLWPPPLQPHGQGEETSIVFTVNGQQRNRICILLQAKVLLIALIKAYLFLRVSRGRAWQLSPSPRRVKSCAGFVHIFCSCVMTINLEKT